MLGIQSQQSGASHLATIYQLENVSDHTCTLDGYPGVQLEDMHFRPLSFPVNQQTGAYFYDNQQPKLVTLAPGTKAYFILESVGQEVECGSCPIATFVSVTAPGDQIGPSDLSLVAMICICTGHVVVSPIEPTAFGFG